MKKKKIKKTKWQIVYEKIEDYRSFLIPAIIIMIPIVFILYILNIHNYIFPKVLRGDIIFRLDIYYRYCMYILAFFYFYDVLYKKEKPTLANIFIYVFLFMTILSTIFAHNKEIALYGYPYRYEGMYTILFYGFLYLNCERIQDSKLIKNWTKIIIGTAIVHYVFVILQLTGIYQKVIYLYSTGHAIGLTENSNFLGSLMSLLSMLSFSYYAFKLEKKNFLSLIIFVISYTCLLLANASGPFISLIVTIICFITYALIKKKKVLKNVLVLIMTMIILYPIVLSKTDKITPELKNHFNYFANKIIIKFQNDDKNNMIDDETSNNNFNGSYEISTDNQLGHGRIRIWNNVFKSIKKNPWLGYGPDNLGLVYEKSIDDSAIADKAHNIYLNIWVSSGIFALLGYVGWLFTNIFRSFKSQDDWIVTLAFGIIAYSIQGLFGINVIEVTPYFFLIMGLMIAETKKQQDKVSF